jgi:hypothetical protein
MDESVFLTLAHKLGFHRVLRHQYNGEGWEFYGDIQTGMRGIHLEDDLRAKSFFARFFEKRRERQIEKVLNRWETYLAADLILLQKTIDELQKGNPEEDIKQLLQKIARWQETLAVDTVYVVSGDFPEINDITDLLSHLREYLDKEISAKTRKWIQNVLEKLVPERDHDVYNQQRKRAQFLHQTILNLDTNIKLNEKVLQTFDDLDSLIRKMEEKIKKVPEDSGIDIKVKRILKEIKVEEATIRKALKICVDAHDKAKKLLKQKPIAFLSKHTPRINHVTQFGDKPAE